MQIGAALSGSEVTVKPMVYLDTNFQSYLEAIKRAGAKYVPERKQHTFPLTGMARLKEELEAAGFSLVLEDQLCHALAAKADVLRNLQARTRARIERFEIEALREVRAYQIIAILFLAMRDKAALFDTQGLGKTCSALLAIPDDPIPPVLVICPSIAKGVWEREARLWRPDFMAPQILEGKNSFRWPKGGEMVIINYDILPEALSLPKVGPLPGTIVIGDEAHNLRNRRTQRSQRFRAIGDAARLNGGKTWLLTGTPLQNRPPELWDVLDAADLARETFSTWARFRELFGGYEGRHGLVWDNTPDEAAVEVLKKTTLRRTREEVLTELPPATYDVIKVDLDAAAEKADRAFEREISEQGLSLQEAIRLARSREGNATFARLSQLREALAIAKIPTMLKIVEEHEEQETPLVVFSAHRAPIEALAKRQGWRVIMGGVSAAERTEIENLFQAGQLKGVAGTIGAMSTAITLTYGSHELFVDRGWTPAENEQAEDRLIRLGQRKSVQITDLVAQSRTDKMLYSILASKKVLVRSTITASARRAEEDTDDLAEGLEQVLQTAVTIDEDALHA